MVPTLPSPDSLDSPISLRRSLPAVVVHTALRREFRLAGPAVRRVDVGDTRRAQLLGSHVDFLLRGLHHHHQLEDEEIWPAVTERAHAHERSVVDAMHAQHEEIGRLVQQAAAVVPGWSAQASAAARDRLASTLEVLHARLVEHLDIEERTALPLAERVLTDAEWHRIGERGEAGNRRDERTLAFGMLAYEGDAEVLASMLSTAPLPVRILVPRLARRAYRRHALAVHGTPTP